MYYTGKSSSGKLVCLVETNPAFIIFQENDTYTLVKGMFCTSEIAYVQKSNDMKGFMFYLDKYIDDGGEKIVDFVGTASELITQNARDKRIKEAVEYMQTIQ